MGILDAPGLSKQQADGRYAPLLTLRRREIPGYAALPTLMASPPATALGAANGATQITSSVLIPMNQPGAFTYFDSGGFHSWDGYVMRLSYLLGVDVIACGSGGTGYLNPGNNPRVKFRDRLSEATNLKPDVLVVAGGINDFGNYTASAIGTEALALFQAIRAALPNTQLVVLSPWWKAGFQTFTSNMMLTKASIKAAAAQVSNTVFLDALQLPLLETPPAATTLQASVASGVTSVSLGVQYPVGTYFQIGTDTNAEVRQVTSTSGTGPYTTTFSSTGGSVLLNAHTAGETVTPCGPCVYTGTGKQSAPASNGNADRYTGSDGTHPTVLGHDNLARWFARAYAATCPA